MGYFKNMDVIIHRAMCISVSGLCFVLLYCIVSGNI